MLAVWTFLAGAKRWFNADMAKAIATVLVVLIVAVTLAVFWGKAESAGGAKRDASWLSKINSGLASVYKARAQKASLSARAAEVEREKMEQERDEAVARSAAIAAELAKMKDDPVVFPKDLVRSMNR
jgi:hypothetical protein